MKFNNGTLALTGIWPQIRHVAGDIGHSIGLLASACWAKAAKLSKLMQLGRMQSVLHSMTDAQLAEIGTERGDIRAHAEFLVNYKYDGL